MSIKVLLVDDHAIIREGLRSLLEKQPEMEVVGDADDGRKALDLVRELLPDIVIMDITMPGMDGITALKKILSDDPAAVVVMITALGQKNKVLESIQAGARDFVVKPFDQDRVQATIKELMKKTKV